MVRSIVAALLVGAAMPAAAATWTITTSGLTGTFTTVDITTPVVANQTAVTNQFASQGITFETAFFDPQTGFFSIPSIGNFNQLGENSNCCMTMRFNPGLRAIAFRYGSNVTVTQFDAYRGATLVASNTFNTFESTTQWLTLTGVTFDSVTIREPLQTAFLVTDIQIAAIPEPASWALLIAGFGLVGAAARRRRMVVAA